MQVFLRTSTDKPGLWWVTCHEPSFWLGPYPTMEGAEEIRTAITEAYEHGREEIRSGLRELIGAVGNVGN